eukprot:TRINITY_DN6241_c0_g1_i1.p1 TRINITY_DN6241_c0_g1~~TRINITY_DN6241_c0_g1_i1.p1  ORF type:complete len:420 (-),score=76.48 TRINITY_DN6241_c0_g1_i1:388-1647(-)
MESTPLFARGVSTSAWNQDKTMLAVASNNEEFFVYNVKNPEDPKSWSPCGKISKDDNHIQLVAALDWCREGKFKDCLLSCSHDRNAYVWMPQKSEEKKNEITGWKPMMVLLRINRAATTCKWSPKGNKFAVASGAKVVPICYFEEQNNWWVCKQLKGFQSTVTCVAWCPNNKFIAIGSTDGKCRIMSAWLKGPKKERIDVDEDDGFGTMWPNQHTFGELLAEFDANSWVNAVAWSPNKMRIAFCGHNSKVHFIQLGEKPIVQTYSHKGLPFMSCEFLSDNTLVCAGFDMSPCMFQQTSTDAAAPKWAFVEQFDKEKKEEKKTTTTTTPTLTSGGGVFGKVQAARAMFGATVQKKETKPSDNKDNKDAKPAIPTKHSNYINTVVPFFDSKNQVLKLATSGLDGRIVVWDLKNTLKTPVKY